MATEPKIKTDPAKAEVITVPPSEWLLELTERTFREVDQANRRIAEMNRKYGR